MDDTYYQQDDYYDLREDESEGDVLTGDPEDALDDLEVFDLPEDVTLAE